MNSKESQVLTLSLLREAGFLSEGDLHFARFCASSLEDRGGTRRQAVETIFAAASRALGAGHSCLPLGILAEQEVLDDEGAVVGRFPPLAQIRQLLQESSALASSKEQGSEGSLSAPFVLDEADRLYLSRYFNHEQVLAARLCSLAEAGDCRTEASEARSFDLESRLEHYFGASSLGAGEDLQKSAARLALTRRFSIVTGGPGTGKTSTVVKILALLVEKARAEAVKRPLVRLLAPTGKAAARLMESVGSALEGLDLAEDLKAELVQEATTIHRALGVHPDNPTRFRRNTLNRMRADVVIVDEASMVDLALMRHLVSALEDEVRLILLGDRYQLASVEAGSVLGELCSAFSVDSEEADSRDLSQRGLRGCTVELKKSYRFTEESGIFALAASIREGEAAQALAVLRSSRSDLCWLDAEQAEGEELLSPQDCPELKSLVVASFANILEGSEAGEVLGAMSRFQILCAHRRGTHGVEAINELVVRLLVQAGKLPSGGEFYRGRMILITRNDYALGLHNGDIGLCWPDEEGGLLVFFRRDDGTLKRVSPSQLPAHESAFALTIHKSQGSEYDEVLTILPNERSALLTRELVYTAVSRARKRVHIFGASASICAAAGRRVTRHTGLGSTIEARMHGSSDR